MVNAAMLPREALNGEFFFVFVSFGLSQLETNSILRASSLMATYITHRAPRSQLSTSLGENVKSFSSRLIRAGPSLLEFIPAMELRYELVMAAFLSSSFEGIMAAMNGVGLQRSSHLCSPFPLERCLWLTSRASYR